MKNLTIVVPFYNGHEHIARLLWGLPKDIPIIIVDDHSDKPLSLSAMENVTVLRPDTKGYFSGAVNAGIEACRTDVLVLNQDTWMVGEEWRDLLEVNRQNYAMIGERIQGTHPAFPAGYIHGTFMYMRRDAINKVGLLNREDFPLWGATAEWQWRAARAGFKILPMSTVPGFRHARGEGNPYGSSISEVLAREPKKKDLLVRTPPLVSVVIPSFNHGKYLRDAVNSLIGGPTSLGDHPGQTMQAFEIIIVDDASTYAESREMAHALADPWKGIHVIQNAQNLGAAAAQNIGINRAVGRFVTVMDGDDMREPHALGALYKACLANPGKVAYDDIRLFSGGARGKVMRMAEYDFDILIHKNQMHKGIMFPRQAWQKAGGYPEAMRQGREDWGFNVALGRVGYCGVRISGAGYLYRREGQNRTLRNTSPEWHEYFEGQIRGIYPDVYEGERPMACCGKSNQSPQPRALSRGLPISRAVEAKPHPGMVLVQYLGNNYGTTVWGGPGSAPSGKSYTFGAGPQQSTKYVFAEDVSWFLGLRERGANLFARVKEAAEQAPAAAPTEEPEAFDKLSSGAPDPSGLTVAEIKQLQLTKAQWAEMLALERLAKNRVSAVEYMEEQIVD